MSEAITVTAASEVERAAIVPLILAQERRQMRLDPCLRRPRLREQVEALLARHERSPLAALVALDTQGQVRGYVQPEIWELPEESTLHAFLTPRNGIAQTLTLPDPREADASAVAIALLHALSACWQEQQTTGALVRWPCADPWIKPILCTQGFLLDSVCTVRSKSSVLLRTPHPLSLHLRLARQPDEAALVDLFCEELAWHEACVPCARLSPAAVQAFQSALARFWADEPLEEGAPLLLVAEHDHRIVALAEHSLLTLSAEDEPGFTPSGRYVCIENVSVHQAVRRQGIGRLLVQASFVALEHLSFDGLLLWYNPDNPLAARFWPRQGFHDLWATYQRLPPATEADDRRGRERKQQREQEHTSRRSML